MPLSITAILEIQDFRDVKMMSLPSINERIAVGGRGMGSRRMDYSRVPLESGKQSLLAFPNLTITVSASSNSVGFPRDAFVSLKQTCANERALHQKTDFTHTKNS